MTVYNGAAYLEQAIKSILAQDFTDFEFLIVDDGSTDESVRIIEEFGDSRICLVRAPHRGLVAALNLGLSEARGLYVARMDADDIARPDRFTVQVGHLNANPQTGLVCSNIRIIESSGRVVGAQREAWTEGTFLRDGLLYRRPMKPIVHPSVMMRRQVGSALGGYREFKAAEDRDFWLRAIDNYRFDRVQQDLLDYRVHSGGLSRGGSAWHEVSSVMSAVNWLVHEQTGVDMFAERAKLFSTLAAVVRDGLERDVLPQALAFRSARSALRSGSQLRAWVKLSSVVLRHGADALPDGARKATLRIIDETVATARRTLKLQEPRWTI